MSRSEKMSPKSYIREHIYEKINTKSSKKKKYHKKTLKF